MNNHLNNAYSEALYWLELDEGRRYFKVGAKSSALDAILQSCHVSQAVFITASNPASEPIAETINRRNNKRLIKQLEDAGFGFFSGFGGDKSRKWPDETSYLVCGMNVQQADILARQYGQNAYLLIEKNRPVVLRWVP